MDLYTLNSRYGIDQVIDTFKSCIWTVRYNSFGDVTLVVPRNVYDAGTIKEGTFLHLNGSNECMIIDTISIEDGLATATGKSMTGFLVNRLLRKDVASIHSNYTITGAPTYIVNELCRSMLMSTREMDTGYVVPYTGHSEIFPDLTQNLSALLPGDNITVLLEYGTVYDSIKTVSDLDNLGFALRPTQFDGSGFLTFESYRGLDRTTSQSANARVIFEPGLDTLANVKELRSLSGYKNVAYAWPKNSGNRANVGVAYAPGVTDATVQFDRRTLMINATDVDANDYTDSAVINGLMIQRAKDGLANNNYVRMLDGKIVPQSAFNYGVDYNLGDIIELRNSALLIQKARVVEYIRAQDATGESAYPTLSVV